MSRKTSRLVFSNKDLHELIKKVDFLQILKDLSMGPVNSNRGSYNHRFFCNFHKVSKKELLVDRGHVCYNSKKKVVKCFCCGIAHRSPINYVMDLFEIPHDRAVLYLDRKYAKLNIKPIKIRPKTRPKILKKITPEMQGYRDDEFDLPF